MGLNLAQIQKDNYDKYVKEVENSYTNVNGLKISKIPSQSSNKSLFNKPTSNNVVANALGTVADVVSQAGAGLGSFFETPLDLGANIIAGGLKLIGADDSAEKVRNFANMDISGNIFGRNDEVMQQQAKDYSYLGDYGKDIAYTVGNVAAMAAGSQALSALGGTANLGKVSANAANVAVNIGKHTLNLPTFAMASGLNAGFKEADEKGANEAQRWAKAITSGLSEGISEGLFGFLGVGGNDITDTLTKTLVNKVPSTVGKVFTRLGINAVGEGAEEVVSYLGEWMADNAIVDKLGDADFKKKWDNGEVLEQFALAAASTLLTGGFDVKMTTNNAIESAEQQLGRKLTNAEKIKVTQAALSGTEANVQPQQTNMTQIQNPSVEDIVEKKPVEKITVQDLVNQEKNGNNTVNLPQAKYQFTMGSNEKLNALHESMAKYFNNSIETQELAKTIDKIIEDKNYNVTFDNSIVNVNGQPVNAQITTGTNGEVNIKINPNSPRAAEFLMIHEITHAIETNTMKDLVLDYANKNAEFRTALEDLKKTYGTNDVSSEVLADISGQLFGNQEFINSLSIEKPNIFRRIYNAIISLANKITGNSNQALFIQDLKNKWQEAYRTQQNNLKENRTEFSINGDGRDFFYRGQQAEGTELSYNDTRFQGSEEEGYYFTPNKETANKYGKNIIERFRNENNTVTVEESNRLQEMATKKLEEHMREGKWYKEDDLLEQMALGRYKAYAEYTGKPFVETGDMFGEDAEAVYYPQYDKEANYKIEEINKQPTKDSQGRELSKAQQEYFKDSKVRDEEGNLEVVYHQTNNDFTEFKNGFSKRGFKNANFFTNQKPNKVLKNLLEGYAKIDNPLYLDNTSINQSIVEKAVVNGYDGIINRNVQGIQGKNEIVTFNSNQFKAVDNLNPTNDPDIRYSKESNEWQDYLERNYPATGTRTNMQDIGKTLLPKEKKIDLPKNPTKESSYDNTLSTQQVRRAKIAEYKAKASEYTKNTINWKDVALLKQKVNTMKRNLRAIMPLNEANAIYEEYFAPISEHNATIEREITKYNNEIEKLNLNDKESTAVQMLGELKYNPDTTLKSDEVNKFITENNLDKTKISNSVETFRKIYDELFTKVNNVLREQGYKEIEYRKGYFPHFNEEHGKTIIGKIAEKLGWKFNSNKLPTDIAGITDQFLPGKKWTTFSQRRTGDVTDYNALKGFDNYVRGAMQLIYHTEDIQKLRGLENQIRYQHSEKGIQEQIDKITNDENLSTEEKQDQIDLAFKDYNNELANFVTNLRDYTNNLAGKKSILDRSAEQLIDRRIYNIMDNVSSRVSANMVGGNLSSAFTNFIPMTQAWSQVKTKNALKSLGKIIESKIKDDGFVDHSTYLTNRINQADRLYKTGLQKFSEKATAIFEAIDSFSSEFIVRSKYLENIENGMNEKQAMKNADEFAKDVMAGRSQGDMPTIFNSKSPVTKLFTAFQLEVNNQYGYMFKDLPNDLKDKGLGNLALAFFKMFLGAWLYNKIAEGLTGRKSAFSPFDMVEEAIQTAKNEDLTDYEKAEKTVKSVIQELPFVSGLLGGGRLPIQGALPDIGTVLESTSNLKDENKKGTAIKNLEKELSKPLYYIALPFGGGQLKKTVEGLSMYNENLPVAGSYTASGNLRFTADESTGGKIKSALFGQYANEEAQKYIDRNYKTVNKSNIQEMKDLGMTASEYLKYRQGLNKSGTKNEDKINYINNSNYTDKQKTIMSNNILKSNKYDFDAEEYKNFNSLDEYKEYKTNPEKYAAITQITDYNTYQGYKNDIKTIKDNTSNDKQETIEYINSLPLNVPQKAMFIRMYYPSYNNYNRQIIEYINNQDLTVEQKTNILRGNGFTVEDGRVY